VIGREHSFFVFGKPATAGSKRAFAHRHTGKIVVLDDCKTGKAWRKAVQHAASVSIRSPLVGPLGLCVSFWLPRPLSHRKKDGSKALGAPEYHLTKPDATKLLRAVEDAMTGIVWLDDAQVIFQSVSKSYADGAQRVGAEVKVFEWRPK
jgi:Holliday junction resolvase RusA-like endonuclease